MAIGNHRHGASESLSLSVHAALLLDDAWQDHNKKTVLFVFNGYRLVFRRPLANRRHPPARRCGLTVPHRTYGSTGYHNPHSEPGARSLTINLQNTLSKYSIN